jgi:Leucine zipper with capping helix domain
MVSADNTYNLQSWCKKRFEGMEAQLDEFFKQVRIPEILFHSVGLLRSSSAPIPE